MRPGMTPRRLTDALRRLRGDGAQASAPVEADAPTAPQGLEHLDAADRAVVERALPYTMTGVARLTALVDAVRHVVRRDVPGAFAECGVWRGGSVLAMLLALQELGVDDRDVHLYDTFEGMTRPSQHDTSPLEPPALETWEEAHRRDERAWDGLFDPDAFNEDAVRETLLATGYPAARIHLHRGPVEATLPGRAPDALALLRLDTDWYESTRHELEHLYPRLASGGVLIVDDYGHWEGARRAVDEYFAAHPPPLLLNRIDYTGRIAVKH
jgi:O-methyltransferase